MLRFSLLALLGVVLVAAIGSAALANPTDIWRQVVVTGAVVALLVATRVALAKHPPLSFALGFAVTGWIYLVVTFSGIFGVREHFLTERVSGWLHERIHHESSAQPSLVAPPVLRSGAVLPRKTDSPWCAPGPPTVLPNPSNFLAINRSLWTFILATIGGLFASWLSRSVKLA